VVGFKDLEGEFATAEGAGFVFDGADECLSDAGTLMGREQMEVVDV
jgi:hypothetical protein